MINASASASNFREIAVSWDVEDEELTVRMGFNLNGLFRAPHLKRSIIHKIMRNVVCCDVMG